MSGKPNAKWKETMLEKHGSEEALKEWLRTLGSKGGAKSGTGGFWYSKMNGLNTHVEAGRKGGTISRKKKKVEIND